MNQVARFGERAALTGMFLLGLCYLAYVFYVPTHASEPPPPPLRARLTRLDRVVPRVAHGTRTSTTTTTTTIDDASYTCMWRFSHYTPSAWEAEWARDIAEIEKRSSEHGGAICDRMMEPDELEKGVYLVARVMEWTDGNVQDGDVAAAAAAADAGQRGTRAYMRQAAETLFSRMHYTLVCTPDGEVLDTDDDDVVVATGYDYIEPLTGLLRDPLSICARLPRTLADLPAHLHTVCPPLEPNLDVTIHFKRWLLLHGATPYHIDMLEVGAAAAGAMPIKHLRLAIDAVGAAIHAAPWMYATHANRTRAAPWTRASRVYIDDTSTVASLSRGDAAARTTKKKRGEAEEHVGIRVSATGVVSLPASLLALPTTTTTTTTRRTVSRAAPRVFLFDLGASYFGRWHDETSAVGAAFFYQLMVRRGMRIDEMYAWEAEVLDPKLEWAQIPADVLPHFHFINVGVTAAPEDARNPWNVLRAVVRPIDHVIVKMDIDTASIEVPLMRQVLDSHDLPALIDEMFFEHHVQVREMSRWWGDGWEHTMRDSYAWYTQLRHAGVRMHSWP